MSDSNRAQLSILAESTRGTTPAGNGQVINYANHSLISTPSSTNSQSIRSDANLVDVIRTDMSPGGGINIELQHENNDGFYESVFRNAFDSQISLSGTTFSVDASGSPITLDDSGSGLGGLKPNDVIMISGFTDSNNNGAFVVGGNTAAGSVDIIAVNPDATPATEAAGDSVTITTTRLENATTVKTFSIEEYNATSSIYRAWLGMEVGSLTIPFGAGQVPTQSITFQGNSEPDVEATIFDGYDTATTNETIDTENGYQGTLLSVNGAALASATTCVTGVTYTITNNINRTKGLNCVTFSTGQFNVGVSATIVFSNKDMYDAFLANQYISIASAAIDSSNQGFGIVVPKVKGLQVSAPVSGPNQTVIATVNGTGILNTSGSDNYTAILSKLG